MQESSENRRKRLQRQSHIKRRVYYIWYGMISRCSEKAVGAIRKNYYDRGIRVCEEWKDFITFKEWALSNGYDSKLQIDRINNDGNYCPENCRWVTHQTNSQKRTNSKLTIDDVIHLKLLIGIGYAPKCITSLTGLSSGFISRVKSGKRWGNIKLSEDMRSVEIT